MTFDQGGIFGQLQLKKLAASIHIKDDLLTNVPKVFKPKHYNLSIMPDLLSPNPKTTYSGNVKMKLECIQADQPSITVHMDGLNIREIKGTFDSWGGEPLVVERVTFDFQKSQVELFSLTIAPIEGDIITLDIDFDAEIDPTQHTHAGLYKEKCSETTEKFCWFTQFESTSARYAFPCIDEPNMKATFDVKVARTDGWNTLCNMPVIDTVPVEGVEGWVWDSFATTPVMPTYLLALAIQDFEGVIGDGNVTIWANKEDIEAGFGAYSQDIGPRIIDFYGSTFNMPYSLPKMDMVSVPKKGGAMENWGLILYSFSTLLYDEGNPDVERKWRVLEVVAHELAHQWFGNLVTMDWWDQTWLNEGFASYVSHLGADAIDPDMNSWGRLLTHRTFQVMKDDSSEQSWAMSDAVQSRGDIHRKFGSITYSKGASVIRMMESILTMDTFIKGMSSYLAALQYGNAVEEDLFLHLEAAGLEDGQWPGTYVNAPSFEDSMKTWTNQAGYPLVTVEKELIEGKPYYKLRQSWYRDNFDNSTDKLWDIPINAVAVEDPTSNWDDTRPTTWLTDETLTIPSPSLGYSGPIVLNKKGTGYYRINYDEENWLLLAETLMTDHHAIHPLNRAQLVCDAITLARTGQLSVTVKDLVLAYMEKEDEFAPRNALKECAPVRSRLPQLEERF